MKKLPVSKTILIIGAIVLVAVCCSGALVVGMFADGKPTTVKTAPPASPAFTAPTFAAPTQAAKPSPSPTQPPKTLQMPELVGQNAAVAQEILKRAGFTNVQLGSAEPKDKLVILPQNWTVTEQSTPAGQTLQSDMLIVLTCAKKR